MYDTPPENGSEHDTGSAADPLSVDAASDLAERVGENVAKVVVGHTETIQHVLVAVLARGHVLLADVPGVGKTVLARSLATSVGGEFSRVQFTPDLLPADVTGANVFDQKRGAFEFRPGPIFGNVVLGDEIDRAPPKTQAALLEAMAEEQVTVDGDTHPLPDPFLVIATRNDVEAERTYDLPAAERDRFMQSLSLGYPTEREETALLGRMTGDHPVESIDPVTTAAELRRARRTAATVEASEPVRNYVTRLATHTRDHATLGASPRAAIALLHAAQARAVLDGRGYVAPDDVQQEARATWRHRIEPESADVTGEEVVARALREVPVEP